MTRRPMMTQKTIVLLFFSSSVPSGRTLCTMVKITASRFCSHDKNQKLFSLLETSLSLLLPQSQNSWHFSHGSGQTFVQIHHSSTILEQREYISGNFVSESVICLSCMMLACWMVPRILWSSGTQVLFTWLQRQENNAIQSILWPCNYPNP